MTGLATIYFFRAVKKCDIASLGVFSGAIAIFVYLVMLYSAFQTSFLVRRFAVEAGVVTEKIVVLELELQKRRANILHADAEEIENMEKISSIHYIKLGDTTAFLPNDVQ